MLDQRDGRIRCSAWLGRVVMLCPWSVRCLSVPTLPPATIRKLITRSTQDLRTVLLRSARARINSKLMNALREMRNATVWQMTESGIRQPCGLFMTRGMDKKDGVRAIRAIGMLIVSPSYCFIESEGHRDVCSGLTDSLHHN